MKNTTNLSRILAVVLAMLLCITMAFTMSACDNSASDTTESTASTTAVASSVDELAAVWADAQYTEDTTLGEGAHNFLFEVAVGDNSVTFTVNTDKTTVGEALLELGIVDGDVEDYGLYVKTVNGILADYDVDASYWAFYQDGEYAMTGVDQTNIEDGAHYEMVYTK